MCNYSISILEYWRNHLPEGRGLSRGAWSAVRWDLAITSLLPWALALAWGCDRAGPGWIWPLCGHRNIIHHENPRLSSSSHSERRSGAPAEATLGRSTHRLHYEGQPSPPAGLPRALGAQGRVLTLQNAHGLVAATTVSASGVVSATGGITPHGAVSPGHSLGPLVRTPSTEKHATLTR